MTYELFYLIAESKESELPKIKESVGKIIESEGAKFQEGEIIEKRKMAYKIKGQFRGVYIARRFELPEKENETDQEKNEIKNITKKLNLNQDVLRFIIVKADELPELRPHETVGREKSAVAISTKKREGRIVPKKATEDKKPKEGTSIDEKLEEILNI